MSAGRYDWLFEPGTTVERTLAWRDAANILVNTTGYGARMQIRQTADAVTALVDASTANGMMTVGRVNLGTANEYNVRWSIPPNVSGAVADFGKAVYDLEITDQTGRITRLLQGYVRYSPEVTR